MALNIYLDKNITRCEQIQHPRYQNICIAGISNNISLCDKYPPGNTCKAAITQNITYCNNYKENSACTNAIMLMKSITSKSHEMCTNITHMYDRYVCYTLINNSMQLKKKYINEMCQNMFYYSLANKTNLSIYCGEITDKETREECTYKTEEKTYYSAINNQNISQCNQISNIILKTKCSEFIDFRNLSVKLVYELGTPEEIWNCTKYTNPHIKDLCYFDYGRNAIDIESCYKIHENKYKNTCLGIVTNNLSFCDKIKDPTYKKICTTPVE